MINDVTNTKDISIGEIEILRNFSFFEADSEYEDLILKSFEGTEYLVQVSKPVNNSEGGGSDRRRETADEVIHLEAEGLNQTEVEEDRVAEDHSLKVVKVENRQEEEPKEDNIKLLYNKPFQN